MSSTLHVDHARQKRLEVLFVTQGGRPTALSFHIPRGDGVAVGHGEAIHATMATTVNGEAVTAPIDATITTYGEALPKAFRLGATVYHPTGTALALIHHMMDTDHEVDIRLKVTYGGATNDNLRNAGLVGDGVYLQVSRDGHHIADVLLDKSIGPADSLARPITHLNE